MYAFTGVQISGGLLIWLLASPNQGFRLWNFQYGVSKILDLPVPNVNLNPCFFYWQRSCNIIAIIFFFLIFSRWGSGEPNNYMNKEHCAEICCPHFLNDINCEKRINYICELDKGKVCYDIQTTLIISGGINVSLAIIPHI